MTLQRNERVTQKTYWLESEKCESRKSHAKVKKKAKGLAGTNRLTLMNYGRGERIRTFDPLVPNQMRYQAALRPDCGYSNRCTLHALATTSADPIQNTRIRMSESTQPLPWLHSGSAFPDVALAWGPQSDAPGLLAAGGDLEVATLQRAYGSGIFPWFSAGQPLLWWSPDPRMVLQTANFRLHRSLRKTLQSFVANASCEIRFDTSFAQVIQACAQAPRQRQSGTWIVPAMVQAYTRWHASGGVHSVETWVDGELVGGLYCVALGRAVFGESMFSKRSDASKIALAALVAFCRAHAIAMIDCQQNTGHLASLGAAEMARGDFLNHLQRAKIRPGVDWQFSPLYWQNILSA